ncbi:MAG: O-antigen ligase family protein, partial [bacterium]
MRALQLGRLTLLTLAALVPVMLAKQGRDLKLLAALPLTALAFAAAWPFILRGGLRFNRGAATPLIAWIASLAIAAGQPHSSTDEFVRQSFFIGAFAASVALFRPGDLRRLGVLWCLSFLWTGGYAVAQRLGLDPVPEFRAFHSAARVFATFGNPDFLGAHLAFLLPPACALAFAAGRRETRIAGWTVAGGIALVLYWTGSRGAWLGAAAGCSAWCVATFGFARMRRALPAAALTGIGLVAALSFAGGLRDTLARRTARVDLWRGAGALLRARPLAGWGLGAFPAEFPPFAPPVFAERMRRDNTFAEHPHSEYLHIAIEAGLPALGCFAWLISVILARGLALSRPGRSLPAAALGALAAVLVHVAVDRNFRLASTAVPFWLLAGALFAAPLRPAGRGLPRLLLAGLSLVPVALVGAAAYSLRPLLSSYRV